MANNSFETGGGQGTIPNDADPFDSLFIDNSPDGSQSPDSIIGKAPQSSLNSLKPARRNAWRHLNPNRTESGGIHIREAEQILADLKNGLTDEEDESSEDNPEQRQRTYNYQTDEWEEETAELRESRIDAEESFLDRFKTKMAKMAGLYAKNTRLLVGGNNRSKFEEARNAYGESLNTYLKAKADKNFNQEKRELAEKLESKLQELTADIEQKINAFSINEDDGSRKTQEEIDREKQRLINDANTLFQYEYGNLIRDSRTKINADFADEYCTKIKELRKATNDKLDNGSICRSFVSKVLNNKVLKGALKAAAVAGLAVTGFSIASGLVAGTLAVGLGYTVGGVALGAAKGALGGLIMSRQDSKTSRVNDFISEEEIRARLSEIDITAENADVGNVTGWALEKYTEASRQDRSSNRKRTAVAMGLGAAIGGFISGLHFSHPVEKTIKTKRIVGNEPVSYEAANLEAVNVSPNHGFYQVFEQLGGNPANKEQALKIAESVFNKYGANTDLAKGIIAPGNGSIDIFPGKISEWPSVAQSCMKEIADTLAAKGLIPANTVGGGPVWGVVERIVTKWVPDAFRHYLTRATAGVGIAVVGGAIGGAGKRSSSLDEAAPSAPSENTPEDVSESESNEENDTGATPETNPEAREIPPVPNEAIENLLTLLQDYPQLLDMLDKMRSERPQS